MENLPLIKWLSKKLSVILECEVGDDYSKNILNMEKSEILLFMQGLIDINKKENKDFVDELISRLSSPSSLQSSEYKVYKKPVIEPEKKSKKKHLHNTKPEESNDYPLHKKTNLIIEKHDKLNDFKVPGRYPCECEASKHKLISNCLKCGRIVCDQEGSGPCFFCGNLVCTKHEMEKINSGSKKGDILKQQLLDNQWVESDLKNNELLTKAIEHKNKLIEFDRNCTKRTQVIDDETDYFQSNNRWLSKNHRDEISKLKVEHDEKRFGSKLKSKTYAFDLDGKKLIEDKISIDYDKILQEINNIENSSNLNIVKSSLNVNQKMHIDAPKFILDDNKKDINLRKNLKTDNFSNLPLNIKIQDKELQQMKDDGMCLSMHQPYASLLIQGIKRHEGRTWYSPYRGRLWIHAGSKQPSKEDINNLENFYTEHYEGKKIEFPDFYPTSCLLGYVDLIDCLDECYYKEQFPNGESNSPFIYIVENPVELIVKIPMSGQHKIFKLDRNIFNIARKTAVKYQ